MQWLEGNRLQIDPPKRPKRITGTRFPTVLGLNPWATPFEAWCAITRTYEEPFVDNKYTIAGKVIEPKVIDYLNKIYFREKLKTPTDIYGKDYFKKTYGNFFPNIKVFGGMWDSLFFRNGEVEAVIEIKTTKRAEDWADGAPEFYALQAALYAYNLGVDRVVMSVSFLEEKDYINPEAFIPSAENTTVEMFKLSERFPQFDQHIERAYAFWDDHVLTGISPPYDEHKDAAILDELRKQTVVANKSIDELIAEGEVLKQQIEEVKATIKEPEKRLQEIIAQVRTYSMDKFGENDDKVVIEGQAYDWILSKSVRTEIDKEALEADGLLDKYSKETESYRFTQMARKTI